VDLLTARLLEEELDPAEMLLVRDALKPHGAEVKDDLWERAGAGSFRALVALATFDPHGARWKDVAGTAADELLKANLLHLAARARLLERPAPRSRVQRSDGRGEARGRGERRAGGGAFRPVPDAAARPPPDRQ